MAGHDNIKDQDALGAPTRRGGPEAICSLGRIGEAVGGGQFAGWVQNPVQGKTPSGENVGNSVIACNLQPAEVVELADTPS